MKLYHTHSRSYGSHLIVKYETLPHRQSLCRALQKVRYTIVGGGKSLILFDLYENRSSTHCKGVLQYGIPSAITCNFQVYNYCVYPIISTRDVTTTSVYQRQCYKRSDTHLQLL